jgi:hypothetical protein
MVRRTIKAMVDDPTPAQAAGGLILLLGRWQKIIV